MADNTPKRRSFSSWLSNTFDNFMGSIADRMAATLNSTISPYNRPGTIRSGASNFFTEYQYDPQYFYDIMEKFPYFHAIVNVFSAACYEVISKDTIKISCSDKKLESQVNQALKDYKLKNFILDHLEEMLKRGTYTGIIGEDEITDIVCPYEGEFISLKGKFLATSIGSNQLPFYDTFSYWYGQTIKNAFTIEEMKKLQPYLNRSKADQQIFQLGNEITAQEETEPENDILEKFKEQVELSTKIFVGKSYFEGVLPDIFRLFLRDYLYDNLSMTEYTKSQLITGTVPSNKADNAKSIEILNDIESCLNTDNINLMMGYADPIQILNQINDKLINRYRVLPQLKDYSDLKEFNLNKDTELLEYLTKDIENSKKAIEDALKIPEAIFTGNGNRWEISSKYEAFTDILVHMLDTVSQAISRFCTSIVYKKTNQYYAPIEFQHHFDINKYISPYSKTSNIAALNDRISELADLLKTTQDIVDNDAIDNKAFVTYLRNELITADPTMESLINYVPVFMQDPKTRSNLPDDFGSNADESGGRMREERGFEEEEFGGGFEEMPEEGGFEEASFGEEEIEEPTPLAEETGFDDMQDAVLDNFFGPEFEE